MKRPNITYKVLKELDDSTRVLNIPKDVYEQIDVIVKYDGILNANKNKLIKQGNLKNSKFRRILTIQPLTIFHLKQRKNWLK